MASKALARCASSVRTALQTVKDHELHHDDDDNDGVDDDDDVGDSAMMRARDFTCQAVCFLKKLCTFIERSASLLKVRQGRQPGCSRGLFKESVWKNHN